MRKRGEKTRKKTHSIVSTTCQRFPAAHRVDLSTSAESEAEEESVEGRVGDPDGAGDDGAVGDLEGCAEDEVAGEDCGDEYRSAGVVGRRGRAGNVLRTIEPAATE